MYNDYDYRAPLGHNSTDITAHFYDKSSCFAISRILTRHLQKGEKVAAEQSQ